MKLPGSIATVCLIVAVSVTLYMRHRGDAPRPSAPPIEQRLRLTGPVEDRPIYEALYIRWETAEGWSPVTAHTWSDLGELDGVVVLEAPRGARFEYSSEKGQPSAAMRDVFWMMVGQGVFPNESKTTDLPMPARVRIRLLPGDAPYGPDVVTVFDETTGAGGWALNDPNEALFEGYGRGDDTDAFKRRALQRPFTCATFRAGKYVVAGRVKGRHWVARRVELRPGEMLELDCGSQPVGGGTVICENGGAILLLGGDLPIPMPYRRTDARFRATWKNVPPGRHAVRYPDGTTVDFDLEDGKTATLPKRPK